MEIGWQEGRNEKKFKEVKDIERNCEQKGREVRGRVVREMDQEDCKCGKGGGRRMKVHVDFMPMSNKGMHNKY